MILNGILLALIALSGFFHEGELPEFKGGAKNLNTFISRNLIYPEYSKQNCLQGTIQISFQLTGKGRIFGSKVQKGYGVDLDQEALRIVRLTSGHWSVPASFDTTQALVIPINFSLKDYNCSQRSGDDIHQAIAAYKAQQDLTKAVFNFYEKRQSGNYSAADEAKIYALKEQLGYNEQYINHILKQALQKLKQGDEEGACEDFNFIKKIGSDKANKFLLDYCYK